VVSCGIQRSGACAAPPTCCGRGRGPVCALIHANRSDKREAAGTAGAVKLLRPARPILLRLPPHFSDLTFPARITTATFDSWWR
jgi:hypothetical protein